MLICAPATRTGGPTACGRLKAAECSADADADSAAAIGRLAVNQLTWRLFDNRETVLDCSHGLVHCAPRPNPTQSMAVSRPFLVVLADMKGNNSVMACSSGRSR